MRVSIRGAKGRTRMRGVRRPQRLSRDNIGSVFALGAGWTIIRGLSGLVGALLLSASSGRLDLYRRQPITANR